MIEHTFHFALWIHNDSRIIFKVYEDPILSPPRLSLPHHHSRKHCMQGKKLMSACCTIGGEAPATCRAEEVSVLTLLPQIRLSLLHCGHEHIAGGCCWQPVETRSPASHGNHIQILSSSVVCAVHDGTYRETQGHPELVSGRTTAPSLGRHGC